MTRKHDVVADYAGIKTVGIPRALLYYRYSALWTSFFEQLGCTVVLSEESNRGHVERGEALSNDECCLASKLYMAHVEDLIGKCDAVFVPSIANYGRFHLFCTKFQALPDLVANTFHREVPLVTCLIEEQIAGQNTQEAFETLARRFGAKKKEAKRIVAKALECQQEAEKKAAKKQKALLKEYSADENCIRILVVAHPYVLKDAFLGKGVIDALEHSGAKVVFAHEFDHETSYNASLGFSRSMPWQVSRELIGAILTNRENIDGIVIVSAFPCGPDSMTSDAVMRCIKGSPILNLTIDGQSGTAGLETRIESFVDILRYQGKGGYV